MHKFFFVIVLLPIMQCHTADQQDNFAKTFNKLNTDPRIIAYSNQKKVNNEGGHLQGIQIFSQKNRDYAFMTGSSSTHAYYGVVRLDANPAVIAINKILEKPFKHAGGFQIYENYMAIGIEDNEARDRSKVYLYEIKDPENPPSKPIAIINRSGEYERATAGAVGITKAGNQFLIVVGDWSSRHLDFYLSVAQDRQQKPIAFKKVHSINAAEVNKGNWINPQWHSYQNINIFSSSGNDLYLIGLGQNKEQKDVADLYKLVSKEDHAYSIQKIASKTFETAKEASFRAGAGVYYSNNVLKIISCGNHIQEESFLNLYDIKGLKNNN